MNIRLAPSLDGLELSLVLSDSVEVSDEQLRDLAWQGFKSFVFEAEEVPDAFTVDRK